MREREGRERERGERERGEREERERGGERRRGRGGGARTIAINEERMLKEEGRKINRLD